MALPIKAPPKQLDPSIIDVVWPGDSAVDLEASDLVTWCREGGQNGLVIKDGETPDTITVKALSPRAVNNCDWVGAQSSINIFDEAFRFGFLKTSAKMPIGFSRLAGVRGLSDTTLDAFGDIMLDLPLNVATFEVEVARGVAVIPDDEDERESLQTERERTVNDVSLTTIVGAHILAHTFRLRRRDA